MSKHKKKRTKSPYDFGWTGEKGSDPLGMEGRTLEAFGKGRRKHDDPLAVFTVEEFYIGVRERVLRMVASQFGQFDPAQISAAFCYDGLFIRASGQEVKGRVCVFRLADTPVCIVIEPSPETLSAVEQALFNYFGERVVKAMGPYLREQERLTARRFEASIEPPTEDGDREVNDAADA